MSVARDQSGSMPIDEKRALLAKLLREKAGGRPPWSSVHGMIEAQARRSPDSAAVVMGGRRLSYRDLDARANRLAHRLRDEGVGPETLVGLCLERSPEMLVAMLGILKAGGAYLPLDPSFPEARLVQMMGDARVPVLITEQSLRESIPVGEATVLAIDSDWAGIEERPDSPLPAAISPANLAYVLYTSGSTGRPKGVQITHGSLSNFLRGMQTLLQVNDRDVLLAVTTLSFDIAGLELLLPLTVGARVELLSREVASDGALLVSRLAEGDATVMQATPATWRMLLDAGWSGSPQLMILCGGEALTRSLADRLIDKGRALWNLYGPTETTIWSSAWRVQPGDVPVAIGGPIANTRLMVLDAKMRPVPMGVVGELFIGGHGVARGYLNRPGLTAERFVPDPLGKPPGGRLYRTGDLARWRADGTLECLGRIDHQVKIRGFRVELGEIEAAMAAIPTVREAAVVSRPDAAGENSLVAFWSPREGAASEVAELRRALQGRLPDYMVPAAFVRLDALPLTPNGKIDRSALPQLETTQPSIGEYVPPRGPVEEALVTIWSELLGRERVGIRDNFFDLGGHSLIATQLVARMRDTFGVEPSLRDFLDEPTVAGLSRLVESALAEGAGLNIPPITPADRTGPIPTSFAQQRMWFLDQFEPDTSSYNIPLAVRLVGDLDVGSLSRALDEVVRRHESLRTVFASAGGVPRQVIHQEASIPLHVDDVAARVDREASALRLLEEEAVRPFDLARGPLIRARLIRLGEHEHIISITMHHIVSDGWSIGVLIREVATLYDAFSNGRPSPLPEPSLQYPDYAAWQREWLQGETLEAQLSYWTGRLRGVATLELPTDRPRPPSASHRGGERSMGLPRAAIDAARAVGRERGATLFMTLLAAFEVLLHHYSGQDDFAVGTPIAGRTRSELEGLIGLFVNTLALRCNLSGDPSFRDLVDRVRQESLGAFAHQDLPFEQAIDELHVERDPSRSPLFQVMFVLQNTPLAVPESPSLEISVMDPISGTSKFDLTLFLHETAGEFLATIEYASDLFDATTIDRMLVHYGVLIGELAANPDVPIGSVSMLTEDEQRQLLGMGLGDSQDAFEDVDDLDGALMDLSFEEDGLDA